MIEAGPALAIHTATRAPADVEAELGIVARLLSGLPTHVHAGEYAAALEAHLASNSDALQQELHRNVQASASGTTGAHPCAWVPPGFSQGTTGTHPKPTVRRVRPARDRALQDAVTAHCTVRAAMFTHARTAAAEPADPDNLAGEAEPRRARAPTVWTCTLPSRVHCTRCTALHAVHARHRALHSHVARQCHCPVRRCRLLLQVAQRPGRAGWLQTLSHLLGRGKRQEAASIVAVVNATEPFGHRTARLQVSGKMRRERTAFIVHEEL